MIHVPSVSGGKDSSWMVIQMLEENMQVDAIVFCDTNVEFPEMYDHIDKLEKYIGLPIIRQKSKKDFIFLFRDFVKRNGQMGYSWPDMKNRWCTQRLKKDEFKKALTKLKRKFNDREVMEYHGIAADEWHRTLKNKEKNIRYPLIEWDLTEANCLKNCYDHGFDWGGLYERFDRVSCYLCPFSNLPELEKLYRHYPELWKIMKKLDANTWRTFKENATIQQLEDRFNQI